MSNTYLVQTTFPDLEEARRVGRALVEARLAACALLAPGAESIYWWEGKVHPLTRKTSTTPDLSRRNLT